VVDMGDNAEIADVFQIHKVRSYLSIA
jgi:hypothetical protein